MKHKLVERILVGILLVIFGGIVIHAPLSVWAGTLWPQHAEIIKSWKELLMGLALVLFVIEVTRRKLVDAFLADRILQLALVYAGLHFVMVSLFQNGLHEAGAGLLIDLRFVLYFVLVYGIMKIVPGYRPLFLKVFISGACVVIGFALLQIFVLPKDILASIGYGKQTIEPYLTVDLNPDYIRINSTLRGPNPLGAYAVIVLSLLVAYALKRSRRVTRKQQWYIGGGAVAVGMVIGSSYSRSSLIGAVVAIIVTMLAVVTAKARRQITLIVLASTIVVGGVLFAARDSSFVSNVILHNNPTSSSAMDSNEGHADSLTDGIKRFVVEPLGAGVGSTGSASLSGKHPLIVENQYLFVAHEVGWLGLGLFVWLFVEIMRRLWVRRSSVLALGVFASGAGLAVIGMLLPVWTDDTVSIIWWGLAAIAIGGIHGARKSH